MAAGTVYVQGARELQRAFNRADKQLATDLRKELRAVGDVVAVEARSRFGGLSARTAAGMKTRLRGGTVAVEQTLRKTTGRRPDWGAVQMRRALEPALDAKTGEVLRRTEQMLDRIGSDNGF